MLVLLGFGDAATGTSMSGSCVIGNPLTLVLLCFGGGLAACPTRVCMLWFGDGAAGAAVSGSYVIGNPRVPSRMCPSC